MVPQLTPNQQRVANILLEAKESILANPTHFDMINWHCNTTACIAGWIVLNDYNKKSGHKGFVARKSNEPGYTPIPDMLKSRDGWPSYPKTAGHIIGVIDYRVLESLFYSEMWAEDFLETLSEGCITAKSAAEYIDYWIEHVLPKVIQ